MKSLHESGAAIPRLLPALFLRSLLRRLVPLTAFLAVGAGLALSPASALQLASRVGFQMPSAPPLATDPKGGNSSLIGMVRAESAAPLTVAMSGPETGDAQLLVTATVGMQTTTHTRAAHLTGTPQTFRMTIAKLTANKVTILTVQLLQNGRSLAQQETRLIANIGQPIQCVLDLTEQAPRVSRSLRAYALTIAQRSNSALTNIHSNFSAPRHLAATPESLPDSAQAYGAIGAVVLDYAYPLEKASTEQQEALREYVRQGGRLILIGSSQNGQISTVRNTFAALQSKPLAAASTENYGVRAALDGIGVVFLAPISALSEAGVTREYQNYRNQAYNRSIGTLWQSLLGANETPHFAPRQALIAATQDNPYSSQMTDALAGRQAAQTVPFPLVAIFLLAYIVLIIPVNYLVLKKLDRRELAWVTAPVLVFVFSGASYAVANAIKGGKMTVNRAVVYEAFANTGAATGSGQFTLYSPRRAAYDLSIGDPKDAANPYRNTTPTEVSQGDRSGPADLTIARDASTTLQNVSVPIYATRSFNLPTAALPGGLEARITLKGSVLRYTLTNHTPYDLHHCYVVLGDQAVPVSDIKAGEMAQAVVAWNGSVGSSNGLMNLEYSLLQTRGRFGLNQPEESAQETRDRIRNAMREGLQSNLVYTNGYDPSNGYTNPSRAVCGFIGWFDAKTLDVRVDGKPAAGEQENMLYVHLPLPQTAKNATTINSPLQWIPDADGSANHAITTQEKTDAE